MRFTEAFSKLGYEVQAPRTDWSAANEFGVCLSLWRSEINWKSLTFDTAVDAGPPATWNSAGNNRRIQHIAQAMQQHGGWVDVVVVDGVPGAGVDKASPWLLSERMGQKWRVLTFNAQSGHFAAAVQKFEGKDGSE